MITPLDNPSKFPLDGLWPSCACAGAQENLVGPHGVHAESWSSKGFKACLRGQVEGARLNAFGFKSKVYVRRLVVRSLGHV